MYKQTTMSFLNVWKEFLMCWKLVFHHNLFFLNCNKR